MRKALLPVLIGLWILGFCGTAFSEQDSNDDVVAIQDKIFFKHHEIAAVFGYIPDDDFFNEYPMGLSYTYNFNDWISWEVIRAQVSVNQQRDIKSKLETEFGVTPSSFPEVNYMMHSHLVLKPFYGKDAIFNKSIINHEGYLFLGGGVINYTKHMSYGDPYHEDVASLSMGFGQKYFLNKYMCMNIEIRDLINFENDKTQNNLWFGISFGLRFNLLPRTTKQEKTIDTFRGYLEEENTD